MPAAESTVRVCRYRVMYALFSSGIGLAIGGALAVWLISTGRIWIGVAMLLVFGILPLGCALMWIPEIGRVVLRITPEGITHYDRFVPWSDIRAVEMKRRNRSPNYIRVTKADGTTFAIFDDYLDRSVESVFQHIRGQLPRACANP